MLKLFRRKNVAKMVLWGLLILILPAFVLWGTGSMSGSKTKGPKFVGTIYGRKVTFEDFANNITSIRIQLLLNYYNQPQLLEKFFNNKPFIGRLAWDRIIMLCEARQNRIRVSDKEVIEYIRSLPIFLRDGKFDERFYQYILRSNLATTPRNFEEMIRENLQMKKLNDAATKDIKATDIEAAESYRKEHQKIKVSYIFIPYGNFTEKVAVTDEDIKRYYDAHKNELVMTPKDKDGKQASRAATFEESKDTLKAMLLENEASPLAAKHAEEEHKKISDMMKDKNMTFEDAAGKLGYTVKDTPLLERNGYLEEMGEIFPVSEAAADMKAGEMSGPVPTRRGVVIFKVLEVQKTDEESFKKSKEGYLKRVLEKKKEALLAGWLKNLESKARLNIDLNDYEQYYR